MIRSVTKTHHARAPFFFFRLSTDVTQCRAIREQTTTTFCVPQIVASTFHVFYLFSSFSENAVLLRGVSVS